MPSPSPHTMSPGQIWVPANSTGTLTSINSRWVEKGRIPAARAKTGMGIAASSSASRTQPSTITAANPWYSAVWQTFSPSSQQGVPSAASTRTSPGLAALITSYWLGSFLEPPPLLGPYFMVMAQPANLLAVGDRGVTPSDQPEMPRRTIASVMKPLGTCLNSLIASSIDIDPT